MPLILLVGNYLFIFRLLLLSFLDNPGSGSADGACMADDMDCLGSLSDRLGMEAIRQLHRQLDDDDNGNIDIAESDDVNRV